MILPSSNILSPRKYVIHYLHFAYVWIFLFDFYLEKFLQLENLINGKYLLLYCPNNVCNIHLFLLFLYYFKKLFFQLELVFKKICPVMQLNENKKDKWLVIFNAGYQDRLELEGVWKHLLGNGWGTKLFQTQLLGFEFFIWKYVFISFPRRVRFQHALIHELQYFSPEAKLSATLTCPILSSLYKWSYLSSTILLHTPCQFAFSQALCSISSKCIIHPSSPDQANSSSLSQIKKYNSSTTPPSIYPHCPLHHFLISPSQLRPTGTSSFLTKP